MFGSLAHDGVVIEDTLVNFQHPFFNVSFQEKYP